MIEELIEQFVDGAEHSISARDWEAYGSCFAEDLLMVTPSLPGITRGREARIRLVQGIMNPFPDGVVEVQRSFGNGDWACLEVLFTGTHTEPMPGPGGTEIPPTNKAVALPYCMVMRFKDGLVSELYEYYDQLDLMTQLGLM
jgi:ketosteroid isomerase-like protein